MWAICGPRAFSLTREGLTGDLGVLVLQVFLPLLGSHVVAEGEQQVLLVEALRLLHFAETGKTQTKKKKKDSLYILTASGRQKLLVPV